MIDVILPTYNRANSLRLVLGSYFSQEYFTRLILVDDASTDDTQSLAKELEQQYGDRFIYHKMPKKSTTPNLRNIGLGYVKSPWVFMGEDDVLLPENHFGVLLNKAQELKADIISGRRIYMFEGQSQQEAIDFANQDYGKIFVKYPFEGYFERVVDKIIKVPYVHANALINSCVFKQVQYDPKYIGNAFREELDFYLRALNSGFESYLIPDTLSFHLKNTKFNSSGGARRFRIKYEWQVWYNSARCFYKNRGILRKYFNIHCIVCFTILFILSRYLYAFSRRLKWLTLSSYAKK